MRLEEYDGFEQIELEITSRPIGIRFAFSSQFQVLKAGKITKNKVLKQGDILFLIDDEVLKSKDKQFLLQKYRTKELPYKSVWLRPTSGALKILLTSISNALTNFFPKCQMLKELDEIEDLNIGEEILSLCHDKCINSTSPVFVPYFSQLYTKHILKLEESPLCKCCKQKSLRITQCELVSVAVNCACCEKLLSSEAPVFICTQRNIFPNHPGEFYVCTECFTNRTYENFDLNEFLDRDWLGLEEERMRKLLGGMGLFQERKRDLLKMFWDFEEFPIEVIHLFCIFEGSLSTSSMPCVTEDCPHFGQMLFDLCCSRCYRRNTNKTLKEAQEMVKDAERFYVNLSGDTKRVALYDVEKHLTMYEFKMLVCKKFVFKRDVDKFNYFYYNSLEHNFLEAKFHGLNAYGSVERQKNALLLCDLGIAEGANINCDWK